MANFEQLEILKQGVKAWNEWQDEHNAINYWALYIDLEEADLRGANLEGANFAQANLRKANLRGTRLYGAHLGQAHLMKADLRGADLMDASLIGANLSEADLTQAHLLRTDFRGAYLYKSNFKEASAEMTIFESVDLSEAIGLEEVHHKGSSTIASNALRRSKGKIPEVFLRGCGLSDWEIESSKLYNPDLPNEEIIKIQYRIYDLRATQALQISPLFISYSHADKPFVDKMDSALTEKGVRFWRDIHDATAGRLETQIDRAIRQNPTVLLVLSKNSLKSDWVEHEVRTARELEKELGRDVLCPIALDENWKSSPWPKRVMDQIMEYNILDFSKWDDASVFKEKFANLLNGLDLFYKKPKEKN